MTKGYGEGGGMRSRLSGARGPHRFLLVAVTLVMLVVGLNYWRLLAVNKDLTDRVRALEELLQSANDKVAGIENSCRSTGEDLRRVNAEIQKLQADLGEKSALLQDKTAMLIALEEERNTLTKKTEDLERQTEQDSSSAQSHLRTVQEELDRTNVKLTKVQETADKCTSLTCDDRMKQLQFDLDTCRYSQGHAANAGIHKSPAGDKLMVGRSSLDRLFESGGMAGFQPKNAPDGREVAVVQSPTAQSEKDAAVAPDPHPVLAKPDIGGAAVAVDGVDVPEVPPAEMLPADVHIISESPKTSSSTAPEVAPVEGDVLPDENDKADRADTAAANVGAGDEGVGAADGDPAGKAVVEEPVEDPAAAEDAAAGEDAPAEQAPAEDGAGLLSRHDELKPAEQLVEGQLLQGGADQLDLAYPNQVKEDADPPEAAPVGEGEQGEPAPRAAETPDVKKAALISELQELPEEARPAPAAADPPQSRDIGDVAGFEQRLDDFEDLPAAGAAP